MNCPKCNTWNPDDKTYCWRCQEELPKPVQKKKKEQRVFLGLPIWMWLAILLFFVVLMLGQCVMLGATG
jgi:predicted nucleic acid-binding Zn ribbon protein